MAVALTEVYVADETILDLGYGQLVASKSAPGSWWVVEDGRCSCPGFEHRGECRHVKAVAAMPREMVEVL